MKVKLVKFQDLATILAIGGNTVLRQVRKLMGRRGVRSDWISKESGCGRDFETLQAGKEKSEERVFLSRRILHLDILVIHLTVEAYQKIPHRNTEKMISKLSDRNEASGFIIGY